MDPPPHTQQLSLYIAFLGGGLEMWGPKASSWKTSFLKGVLVFMKILLQWCGNSCAGKSKGQTRTGRGGSVWSRWGEKEGDDLWKLARWSVWVSQVSKNTVAFCLLSLTWRHRGAQSCLALSWRDVERFLWSWLTSPSSGTFSQTCFSPSALSSLPLCFGLTRLDPRVSWFTLLSLPPQRSPTRTLHDGFFLPLSSSQVPRHLMASSHEPHFALSFSKVI